MTGPLAYHARALRRFLRDEEGATLVEFTLVFGLYLLVFFGLLDFGRLAFHYVNMQRGLQVAARVAAVRPAACAGVPETNERGVTPKDETEPQFGTNCSAKSWVCAAPATVSCSGATTNATVAEIWPIVAPALPNGSTAANLSFSYSYDSELGFLGGPYVPMVTVELQNVSFQFATPLGALVGLVTGTADENLDADIAFPSMSTSMPGEDLAQGAGS
ncbi:MULTISPECIES: TadE/TadG family type IV pilus assembly protein [unclassified Thioclava]|uniref:TadE/TadG family type IV pilus assembly protein n=1 Tax=unclassified Thioclava TaxID=2621713 RepID=UPI000995FA3B|nr:MULTISPECIES: TadE/TadG family type IV pilus assembly protein [unclassified Thioclava]OOY09379.1 hypothetical protein BMI89_06065 [Thioclava sp. F36-7]OOY17749.1 hypothetical protein BMI85_02000 [Thioclava sp. DLFJ4-1]